MKDLKEIRGEIITAVGTLVGLINNDVEDGIFKDMCHPLIKYKIENGNKIAIINYEEIEQEALKLWHEYNQH